MKTVNVEFKKNGKQYIFLDNNIELFPGDIVIVETERGQQFGTITSIIGVADNETNHAYVIKKANDNDIRQNEKNIKEAEKANQKAQELSDQLGLEMKFIDTYFTFDRKQLVFQFIADNRVDFRELAKQLGGIYKTRIELRQVGARDKAKEISGIGQCGRKLCCSSFLNDMDSIGIAQVKNQNLALNPNKINGLCGRLLCCLKYEDDIYSEYRKILPEVGDKVKYNGQVVTVVSLDILKRKYTILTEDNERIELEAKKMEENNRKDFKHGKRRNGNK